MVDNASLSAYGPNLALAENGGILSVSTPHPKRLSGVLNDGVQPVGSRFHPYNGPQPVSAYFWDSQERSQPDWAQIEWSDMRAVDEIVLRMPIFHRSTTDWRTIRKLTVSYWDDSTGWHAIQSNHGRPNPIETWVAPDVSDGSELRVLSFEVIMTTKIRVTIDQGNSDNVSFLAEIEIYRRDIARAPFQMHPAPTDRILLRPNDVYPLVATVTDKAGNAIAGLPVIFEPRVGGGSVVGEGDTQSKKVVVNTDRLGHARVLAVAGGKPGHNTHSARHDETGELLEFQAEAVAAHKALAEALDWLETAAASLIHGCQMIAFDGTVMYTPDGVGSYAGFWVRDFEYMIEGSPSEIPLSDIARGFEYLIARQRGDGAMPNKVQQDGTPFYCPFTGCDSIFGPVPPPDNPQFMVKIAYHYTRLSGDLSLFQQHSANLVRGMEFIARSPRNSLIYISPDNPSSPYGFTDAVAKTGDQLFDSLLYYEAAMHLAELFSDCGEVSESHRWLQEADQIQLDLQTLFDSNAGMFLAASEDCRQVDIWGSAYATVVGLASDAQRQSIAKYLADNYHGVVRAGQVRHTAPGEFWQRTIVPGDDIYQNGPYWAVPSGWVALAIKPVDRGLAERMLVDLVRDFQLNGINEAVDPETGYVAIPDYVASATNPLPALRTLVREASTA